MVDKCLGHQRIAAAALASAVAPTIPTGTRELHLYADTAGVRFRLDGEDPTADIGGLVVAGASGPIVITLSQSLHSIKFIAASGSPNLNIVYFGQSDS